MNMQIDEMTARDIMKHKEEFMRSFHRGSIYNLDGANGSQPNITGPNLDSNSSPNPMMIVRTASNSSLTIMPNGDRQTRFTLHHSVSFLRNSFEVVEEES